MRKNVGINVLRRGLSLPKGGMLPNSRIAGEGICPGCSARQWDSEPIALLPLGYGPEKSREENATNPTTAGLPTGSGVVQAPPTSLHTRGFGASAGKAIFP